jgi:hypothetical protein
MEETAALISADIEIKSNETGTAYLFKDTLDLTLPPFKVRALVD